MSSLASNLHAPVLVLYYALAFAAFLQGVWLLRVLFDPDLVSLDQLGAYRKRYLTLLIAQWIVSIGLGFVSPAVRRFEVYYFALLLIPIFLSAWYAAIARKGQATGGLALLLVFLSVVSLFGVGFLGFYG